MGGSMSRPAFAERIPACGRSDNPCPLTVSPRKTGGGVRGACREPRAPRFVFPPAMTSDSLRAPVTALETRYNERPNQKPFVDAHAHQIGPQDQEKPGQD